MSEDFTKGVGVATPTPTSSLSDFGAKDSAEFPAEIVAPTKAFLSQNTSHTIIQTQETKGKREHHGIDTDDLEAQKAQRPSRRRTYFHFIRYTALNVYRRLFSLVFLANLAMFVTIMVTDQSSLLAFVNAAAANLTACGLARQPLVVNTIYLIVCSVPRSAPLRLRRIAAKAFHLGGVHSGCGVASLLWYVGLVALISIRYWFPNEDGVGDAGRVTTISTAVIVLAYIILLLLLFIITAAFPAFRSKHHDVFELMHRFSAWAVVALFLVLLLLFANEARQAEQLSLGQYLIRLPAFWMLLVVIAAIIHPYLLLRKVKVEPEKLSRHAIRLHMNHAKPGFGLGIQLSRHPLRDWHSFATFPDCIPERDSKVGPGSGSFSCLISKAGDWTGETIEHPPRHLWKRGVLVYGFAYVMRVFTRIIVVTTGSGIGPCLSFLGDENRPAMRVMWQTRSPVKTYGEGIIDLVKQMDPDPLIMDTDQRGGRVDMVPIIERMAREFRAEAVCVISNPRLTKQLVYALETRGLVAMGPIFDS